MLRFVYFRVRAAKNPAPENVFFVFLFILLYGLSLSLSKKTLEKQLRKPMRFGIILL